MRLVILKRIAFVGKSMLWSLCLYVVMMLAFNWDEIKNTMTDNNSSVVITSELDQSQSVFNKQSVPATISQHAGAVKGILTLVKVICGLSDKIGK